MKQYRVALIGLGVISRYYLRAVEQLPSLSLAAVCSRSGTATEKLPEGVPLYTDYRQMISEIGPDIVIVATPNHLHFTMATDALRAGCHVLCEKPLAITPGEIRKLISMARRHKRLLLTVFHRRYNRQIQDLLAGSLAEKPGIIIARYLENIPDHSDNKYWYRSLAQSGGGCVIDNGINVFDVLLHLTGELRIRRVQVGYAGTGKNRHDANAWIACTYPGGEAYIELDWYFPGEVKDLTLYTGRNGVVRRDFLEGSTEFKSSLWHEYESALGEAVGFLESGRYPADEPSLAASLLVQRVYRIIQKGR